jgi:hypothetical protein
MEDPGVDCPFLIHSGVGSGEDSGVDSEYDSGVDSGVDLLWRIFYGGLWH